MVEFLKHTGPEWKQVPLSNAGPESTTLRINCWLQKYYSKHRIQFSPRSKRGKEKDVIFNFVDVIVSGK